MGIILHCSRGRGTNQSRHINLPIKFFYKTQESMSFFLHWFVRSPEKKGTNKCKSEQLWQLCFAAASAAGTEVAEPGALKKRGKEQFGYSEEQTYASYLTLVVPSIWMDSSVIIVHCDCGRTDLSHLLQRCDKPSCKVSIRVNERGLLRYATRRTFFSDERKWSTIGTHFAVLLPPRCQFNDAVRLATRIFAIKFKVSLPISPL